MTAPQTPTTAEELRGVGLRVTAARVALLDTVRDGDHLGVEAIAARFGDPQTGEADVDGCAAIDEVLAEFHRLELAEPVRR